MKQNIIRLFVMAVFSAVFMGCSVDETGIEGSFPYLEVEVTSMQLSKVAHTQPINVKTNRGLVFKFTPSVDWISAEYDRDNGVINLIVTPNDLEYTRSVTMGITTSNSTVYKEIVLTQDASGELTHTGDLILRSKDEIAQNTYTKVAVAFDGSSAGYLVIGEVAAPTRSVNKYVSSEIGDSYYTVADSDISDSDIATLTETIHQVAGRGLVIANTEVTAIPQELIKANGIDKLAFDYNAITVLPSATEMTELNLKELSLKGNYLSDISSLAGNTTIERLDISENAVYNLDALKSMPNLQTAVLSGLPLTSQQLEVYKESIGFEVVAENLNSDNSPLPIFGEVEVVEVSDTEVHLSVPVLNNAQNISNYGFYIGNKRNLDDMTFNTAEYSDGTLKLVYYPETILGKIFYVRAYAENTSGGNYSKVAHFGNVILDGNLELKSDEDFAEFADYPYSHINGSLLVGKMSQYNASGVLLDDGAFTYFFSPVTFADMTPLRQVAYVRDGLYMGNVGVTNLDYVSHIQGLQTLWVKANNISYIPELESDQTLKTLDVSMNKLTDFNFLERMPDLEKLYLGASQTASQETNDIGVLTGLENYTNLKYIDLSGLPLHDWQVERLREQMPETDIEFTSAGRTPHLPAVSFGRVTRSESSVTLSGSVASKGKSDILEYGFYFGKAGETLEKYSVGSSISEGTIFNLTIDLPDMDIYHYYPYAINSQGESWCESEEVSLSYMNLSSGETANCYLISTPGRYKFDARVCGNSVQSVGDPSYVEVVWQFRTHYDWTPIISTVEFEDGFVKFEVPEDAVYGNALIAVKDSQGTILWSWHIWLCDFNPDTDSQVYWDGVKMMDRNLGATCTTSTTYDEKLRASGTMYQWGRKDPFTQGTYTGWYSGSIETLDYAHNNPTILVSGTPHWYYPSDYSAFSALWSSEQKTMYDPCPPGWMVADRAVFEGTYPQYGDDYHVKIVYNSNKTSQYPLTPWFDSNANYSEWVEGRLWISSIDNGSMWPWAVSYASGSLNIGQHDASYAMSVRCMKDLGLSFSEVQVSPSLYTAAVSATITCKFGFVSQKGFVWCTTGYGTPTLSNNSVNLGSGAGTLSATIENLASDTSYYVRAYAVVDGATKYGPTVEFKTGRGGSGDDFTEDDYIWE